MIGRNNTLLTFVSFLFWTVTSIAQPSSLPFLHYDSSHSFPQIAISGFQQDSIGRLWISSEKNGLFCYDGNSVTHEVKKGVISFFIDDNFYVCCADSLCILKDRNLHAVFRGPLRNGVGKLPDGKIVFSSRTQVHTYCPKSGKTTSSIDPGYLITSQYVCGKTIYLGTSKGKLLTFDGEKFLEKASLSHEIVSIRENGDDGLFCCTLTAGLFLITQDGQISKRISTDTSPVSINSSCALDACMDEQHRLWVGTLNGLDIIDIEEETVSHYISNQQVHYSLSNNTVRRLFRDSQGGMWLGTYYGGVNYVHMSWNNFSHLTEGEGLWHLNDDIVNCMAMGNDDELFLGTNKKGINVCHLRTGRMEFIDIRKAAGFKSGEFNDVKVIWPEPGTNRIYIGCHKGGLLYMEKSSRKAHSILHNINISYVNRFTDCK